MVADRHPAVLAGLRPLATRLDTAVPYQLVGMSARWAVPG
jgi:hypothetical protein